MSQQQSLTTIIEDVGERILDNIDSDTDFPPELESWMEEFGLRKAPDPERTVCNLTAFNHLLKLTLYRVYRQEGTALNPLSRSKDIPTQLLAALEETGDEAFNENPLDHLVNTLNQETLAPLLDARDVVEGLEKPTNAIGMTFESLVAQAARRKRGQFRTPVFVGKFMTQWAVRAGDDIVLDPGIGAGVLTACLYDAKQAAPGATHVDEMWGVDVSELAIVMASTGLKLKNGDGSPNFFHQDYMDTVVDGASTYITQQDSEHLPPVDAIVSNPPYSQNEKLKKDRQRYDEIINTEAGISIWGQPSLLAYFFVHSEQFLKDGGRLAFITSSRFLDSKYGEDLKSFLRGQFSIRAFVFLDMEKDVFKNTDVLPCITLLEKDSVTQNREIAFVRVEKWPDDPQLLVDVVSDETRDEISFGYVNRVSQGKLETDNDWRDYVDSIELDSILGLTTFSQLAEIKRGIATGKNDYFCLTQNEVDTWGLDERYLSRLIRRTSGFNGLKIAERHWQSWKDRGDEVWLLYCYDGDDPITNVSDDALEAYLEYGRSVGAADTYLATKRNPWHVVEKRDPPDILATYMSKDGFRFIRNDAGIRTLNNLHNIILPEFNDDEIDALLAYLNSSIADEITKRSGRTYARGLHKIEPNELKNVPVLDTTSIDSVTLEQLAESYRNLCKSINNIDQNSDEAEARLDSTVRDALEFK